VSALSTNAFAASGAAAGSRPYVDVHAHLGDTVSRYPACSQSAEKYLARMADSNVVAAVPCPAGGGPQARGVLDTRDQNEQIADACRRRPDRFPIGMGIVEVRHLQPGVDELERSMDHSGLLGFMIHPGLSGHAMAEELWPFLEVVDARKGLVLLHVAGGGHEPRVARHAKRFKNTTFIMAHVTFRAGQHTVAAESFGGLENVWCDIAQQAQGYDDAIPELVKGVGADRIVFGSDIPYYDYRRLQRQIEASPVDAATKDKIAAGNAVDLIRRFRPDWQVPATPTPAPAGFESVDLWEELPNQPGRLR
jgi:uncharacterized protein